MEQQLLGDRYQLTRRIGVGGMAQVYVAQDRLLGRDVAVKILHEDSAGDATYVERFRREAKAVAQLNHPNVVAVYDWGHTASAASAGRADYFMVMEYVPGPNLKEVVRARGPLPEDEALSIAAQIASALEVAHEHGLVHRDVKPHNVLIAPNGRAKVADFGIAHDAGLTELTRTNIVPGTAHYLSPEQAQRAVLDGRSDIYSLGVVLYEMLTGHVPFEGRSLVDVALQHVHDKPAPPRKVRPELSRATEAIVLKALEKDPKKRFQTAEAMRQALERARVQRDEPLPVPPDQRATDPMPGRQNTVQAPLTGPRERARRVIPPPERVEPAERRGLWFVALPFALLLLIGGGVYAVLHQGGNSAGKHAIPPAIVSQKTATPTPTSTRPPPTHPPHHHVVVIPIPKPTTRPASTATATSAPSATATVAPTAAPTAQPSATTPLPTASIAPSTVVAASGPGSPTDAVANFYSLVDQRKYDQAAGLWSSTMKASYPPTDNINGHFSQYTDVFLQSSKLVHQSNGAATVYVTVTEVGPSGNTTVSGNWYLIRGPSGWLLDSEGLG